MVFSCCHSEHQRRILLFPKQDLSLALKMTVGIGLRRICDFAAQLHPDIAELVLAVAV